MHKKSIVLYFPESSNTQTIARLIQSQTDSDLEEIKTVNPYVKGYSALVEQAKKEIRDGYHPPIQALKCDLASYDILFLGTPNWWSSIAPPVATMLSENNLSGMVIAPFITHGGGGKGHAEKDIKKLCPNSEVKKMLDIYGDGGAAAEEKIAAWIEVNGLKNKS